MTLKLLGDDEDQCRQLVNDAKTMYQDDEEQQSHDDW